ncbi:MAG: hypothetical protein KA821_11230 [Chitinophagaceae bacterium]|nr:hypothetical protein [Chitinophagaceae bacterium]
MLLAVLGLIIVAWVTLTFSNIGKPRRHYRFKSRNAHSAHSTGKLKK